MYFVSYIKVSCKINNNSLILSKVGVSLGAAAHASEIRKHNSNDAKCGKLGWVCIPLVVETYGAWGQEAVKSFAQLASRLAIACSKPKLVVINDLYGRLNTCLIRSISLAILSRMVSTHMEKWPIHRRSSCILFQIEF